MGLTFILRYGSILSWIRNFLTKAKFFKELFSCSLCLGFWSGVFHSIVLYFLNWDILYIFLPTVSSLVSYAADSTIRLIQSCDLTLDKVRRRI